MGEYIFSIYAKWQLGLSIRFDGQIVLSIFFIDMRFSVSKYAKGVEVFGKYFILFKEKRIIPDEFGGL